MSVMLHKADFYIMLEFTTGVMFLMSSLYGAGQIDTAVNTKDNSSTTKGTAIEMKANLTDEGKIEAYIKSEYADTPILIEIARCESRFHQFNKDGTVVRGEKNNKDVGIMQINEKYHSEDAINKGYDIYTAEGNIAFGKYLYEKYGTSPWKSSSKCWSQELAKK